MNRNKITLVVLVSLIVIASLAWWMRSSNTLEGELSDFAIEDTASVDQIFLADKNGHQVTLKRVNDGSWSVNGKFTARKDAIDNLLYTIRTVQVKSPVGKNLYNNTMKLMAATSVKIEVYSQGKVVKKYYVGHPTMDNLGTFMYIENSTRPFITHIPGFNGFLTTRYFALETEWRDKSIFRFDPRKITKVRIDEYLRPARTCELQRMADSSFTLAAGPQALAVQPLDINKVRLFLSAFSATYFERIDGEMNSVQVDSIKRSNPFAKVLVMTDGGASRELTCYRKPVTSSTRLQLDPVSGEPVPFDLDKFYAFMSGDSSMLVCQYFHFDRVLKDPQNFQPGPDKTPSQARF
jgi:hypothetical protein